MMEKVKILEELELLEVLLDAYNSNPQLMDQEGASDYIDSILDRINELKQKLNNIPL